MEKGKPALQAAAEGTSEIALAVMATTLCILAVFVPVGNMGEVIGQFFKQFGLTVAFAVAFSLFVAFTLTPTLSAYWLKVDHTPAKPVGILKWIQKILDAWEHNFINLRDYYKQLLSWALKRPKKLIALAMLSLFINLLLLPFLGTEFQPAYDSGEFNLILEAPAGTSLERMQQLIQPVEKEVLQISGLETAFVVIGAQRNPVYKATIGVRMIPSDQRSVSMLAIMDELRIKFRNVQGLKVAVQSNQGVGGGDSRPVQIGLRGPDLAVLQQLARELADNIRQIQGTADVDISGAQSELEVQIRLDPTRMGQVGIDAALAGTAVQTAFLGITTKNQFNIADNDYNIRVQMPQSSRSNIDDVANLRIVGKGGNFVRLGDIAEVKFSSGPTQIDREGRQRQVIVYANAIGVSSGDVINKVQSTILPNMNLPFGYTYRLVGQARTMQDSFREITKALVLAIVLIYMVLAAEFESFIHPLTIMLSLPFSLIGAILGLLLAGKTINIMSMIGIIMLMGLVTKNAILLIDYTNQLRDQGMNIMEALVEAGSVRLRPILMTTMAMILGMAPIALGIGAGAELRSSMGVVLVGGLITSTILTLLIVPLVYLLIDKMQNYFKNRKAKKDITASI
jgi:HAE1 family hydrophobic/amphiphilic exporter-1